MPRQHWGELDDVLEQSAVQLFVARLRALDPTFAVSRENVHLIVAICHHLDGVPLAIEFAAARAATLGVRYVASHLEDRFGLLTGGRRTALPKHRTLRAALDWGYELLPETEQSLLGRLAIFDAGFTLEAVTAVVSGAGSRVGSSGTHRTSCREIVRDPRINHRPAAGGRCLRR